MVVFTAEGPLFTTTTIVVAVALSRGTSSPLSSSPPTSASSVEPIPMTTTLNATVVDSSQEKVEAVAEQCKFGFGNIPELFAYRWILGAIVPPIILIGLFTNIVSICVFSRKSMRRNMTNIYLLFLGISDSVYLISTLLANSMSEISSIFEWVSIRYFYDPILPVTTMSSNASYLTSVWYTVGMCLHRFIACWFPLKSKRILSTRRVRAYLLVVPLLAALFSLSTAFEWTTKPCVILPYNEVIPFREPTPFHYNVVYQRVWITTFAVFAYLLPFTILAVVNTLGPISIYIKSMI